MNRKENWIQETLNSIENIHDAEFSPQLSEKILTNAVAAKGKVISMQPAVKWAAAACIVLLGGVNMVSIVQYNKSGSSLQNESNPVYNEYFSYLNDL